MKKPLEWGITVGSGLLENNLLARKKLERYKHSSLFPPAVTKNVSWH
jgi:hypothetical protein